MVNWVKALLQGWKDITKVLEEILVDNISATVPWLAPVLPAYIAYLNMLNILKLGQTVSTIGAVVIEFLGLSTISTAFKLWEYSDSNKENDKKKVKVPLKVSIGVAVFYIVIVIVVNVILDIGKSSAFNIISKALLSTLSIAGAVTLSVRSQHSRRLAIQETEDVKNEEKEFIDRQEKERKEKEDKEERDRKAREEFELAQEKLRMQFELEKKRIETEALKETERIRVEKEQATELAKARIEARERRKMSQMSQMSNQTLDENGNQIMFSRGYAGYLEYLEWLKFQEKPFNKKQAAVDMGKSVKQIERYMDMEQGSAPIVLEDDHKNGKVHNNVGINP